MSSIDWRLKTITPVPPGVGNIIAVCLYLVIALIGISGNSLVILSMSMCRRLQTSANAFVVALSVSDFLTSLTLPIHGAALLGIWSTVFFLLLQHCCDLLLHPHRIECLSSDGNCVQPLHPHHQALTDISEMVSEETRSLHDRTLLRDTFSRNGSCPCPRSSEQVGYVPKYKANVNTCTVWGQIFDYVAASFILIPLVLTLVFYILIYAQIRYHFRAVAVRVSHDDDYQCHLWRP